MYNFIATIDDVARAMDHRQTHCLIQTDCKQLLNLCFYELWEHKRSSTGLSPLQVVQLGAVRLTLNLSPLRLSKGPDRRSHFETPLSFKRHRFPVAVIREAVWLHLCPSLSLRDVDQFMARDGLR